MLIPYNTDAPIYHWPIATVGLIVLNVVVFFGSPHYAPKRPIDEAASEEWHELVDQMSDIDSREEFEEITQKLEANQRNRKPPPRHPWTLWYGDGWHPTQWVTSNFMHAGFMHLAGNMLFLWVFGLVCEGKLGWWRYLPVYLGVGAAQCALEQTIMGAIPAAAGQYSLGASAAIFGLLAMALVWAPVNNFKCILIIYYRAFFFEMPIYALALIDFGLELLYAWLGGFGPSSPVLHLMGAGFGLVIGIALLKLNWVDCEDWDVFSLRKDRSVKLLGDIRSEQQALHEELLEESQSPEANEAHGEARREAALRNIPEYLDAGAHQAAAALFWETDRTCRGWKLRQRDHLRLIAAFDRAGQERESIPLMTRYLRDHDSQAAQVRIKLAEILIHQEERPSKALRILDRIPPGQLTPKVSARVTKLRAEAATLIVEGVLELEEDDEDV